MCLSQKCITTVWQILRLISYGIWLFRQKKIVLRSQYVEILALQWNSVNKSTVNKSSRLLHPTCLERNRLVHFRKRRLL